MCPPLKRWTAPECWKCSTLPKSTTDADLLFSSLWSPSPLTFVPERCWQRGENEDQINVLWAICFPEAAFCKTKANQIKAFISSTVCCSNLLPLISTWEFDYGSDCSDEYYTFHNGDYSDNGLIPMYFVLQPIGELRSWPDRQYEPPDVASPPVRWECRIYRIQDQL